MKLLNGRELADFIKERQSKEVRSIKQSLGVKPTLVIVRTNPSPIIDTYVRLKSSYGEDIGVEVRILDIPENLLEPSIDNLNKDNTVHGIIIQLPLKDESMTEKVVNMVEAKKDVDGLAKDSLFDSATPTAINWLLAGYNIELLGKKIVIVGQGRLVGKPLADIWLASGLDVSVADKNTKDLKGLTVSADILVTATGQPGVISTDMIKEGAVVVDAGVATDSGGLIGDVDASVREREDLKITPLKGGVGPLTISALFDNVLKAARNSIN